MSKEQPGCSSARQWQLPQADDIWLVEAEDDVPLCPLTPGCNIPSKLRLKLNLLIFDCRKYHSLKTNCGILPASVNIYKTCKKTAFWSNQQNVMVPQCQPTIYAKTRFCKFAFTL